MTSCRSVHVQAVIAAVYIARSHMPYAWLGTEVTNVVLHLAKVTLAILQSSVRSH